MRTICLLSIVCFSLQCGFASEPYHVDVTQEAFTEYTDSIDHLEPVNQTVPKFYYLAQFIESTSFTKGTYFAVFKTKQGRYMLQLASIPADNLPAERPKAGTELEISESLAKVIYQIWVNALLEVRHDRKMYRGLDGEDFIFSTFVRGTGWMHGCIWSPHADLPPKWLVDSAHEIIAFARNPKRDSKKTETVLSEKRDRLYKYIQELGRH